MSTSESEAARLDKLARLALSGDADDPVEIPDGLLVSLDPVTPATASELARHALGATRATSTMESEQS